MNLHVRKAVAILSGVMIAFAGCKEKTTDGLVISEKDAKEVAFEDVATNIRIVPLKSDEPIATIKNVVSYGNEVLACDVNEKIIYYFVDGKLVAKLNRIGRGPGEYTAIRRFAYSPSRKVLYVMTPDKIVWYTIPDLKYCGDTPLNQETHCLSMHDDSHFFALIFKDYKWETVLIDIKTGEITQELQETTIYAKKESYRSMASYSESSHYYSTLGYNNSVVAVTDGGKAKTLLTYNFGDRNIEEKYTDFEKYYDPTNMFPMYDFENEQFRYMDENGKKILVTVPSPRINENGEIFIWYAYYITIDGMFYMYRYNPKDKTSQNLKGFRMKGIRHPITPDVLSDTGYIKVFQASNRWIQNEEEPSGLAKSLIQAVRNQNDDNPVLLFFDIL